MTAPATWHTIDMRWRLVRAGDVVLDPDGNPWMVEVANGRGNGRGARHRLFVVRRGDQLLGRERDPDQTVPVLVRSDVVAAVEVAARELGPVRVLERE